MHRCSCGARLVECGGIYRRPTESDRKRMYPVVANAVCSKCGSTDYYGRDLGKRCTHERCVASNSVSWSCPN